VGQFFLEKFFGKISSDGNITGVLDIRWVFEHKPSFEHNMSFAGSARFWRILRGDCEESNFFRNFFLEISPCVNVRDPVAI